MSQEGNVKTINSVSNAISKANNTSLGLNAGLYVPVTQGYSAGGSITNGTSWSATDANTARMWSDYQAGVAYERQKELQNMAQSYNAAEALAARNYTSNEAYKSREFNASEAVKERRYNAEQAAAARKFNSVEASKARDFEQAMINKEQRYNSLEALTQRQWQQKMADTIYTRSVKNMREAGINPILAYNMGLTGAAVGSGATASYSGINTPAATGGAASYGGTASGGFGTGTAASSGIGSAPMAQSFMDSQSGSSNYGSSWESSENGIATALSALGEMAKTMAAAVNTGTNISIMMDALNSDALSGVVGDAIKVLTGDKPLSDYTGVKNGSKGVFTGSSKHIAQTSSSGRVHGGTSGKVTTAKGRYTK